MAKVSITHHHDYMRFIVTFQDGRKAKGNFSRGGDTVKVEPEDLALVRAISQTFADDKARGRRDPDWNLMKTFEVVKRVGDEARTLEGFLAALDAGFTPSTIVVAPGTTVIWRNEGSSNHVVRFPDQESFRIPPGETYRRRFDRSGEFSYVCGIHPSMTGKVIVRQP